MYSYYIHGRSLNTLNHIISWNSVVMVLFGVPPLISQKLFAPQEPVITWTMVIQEKKNGLEHILKIRRDKASYGMA